MKPINILIADDNEDFSVLLREFFLLQKDVRAVEIALDGIEAIEKLKTRNPDVLILDMIMPKLDGFGVLAKIKSTRHIHKNLKIIILSSIGQDNITQKALEMGADYYLMKPFDFNSLMCRISEMLESDLPTGKSLPFSYNERERKISDFLHQSGVPSHINGYQYLKKAIQMMLDDESALTSMTTSIYPIIAEFYKTTGSRVERSMRHAIELAWNKHNSQMKEMLGNVENKPSNREFISMARDKILGDE